MKALRAVRRAMLGACALGLAFVPAYFGYQALAGVGGLPAGAAVSAPPHPNTEQREGDWLGPLRQTPSGPLIAAAAPAGAMSEASCPSLEDAYAAIAAGTQGADISAISLALAEVYADPTGAAGSDASPLAQRLRQALGLQASAPVCPTVVAALREAVQLAQIASAAEAVGPITGSVGAPTPLSPSYSTIRAGTAGGARGHGYCADVTGGCVG